MKNALTQVVADCELMFSHLCQHRPDRVPKRVPAHAGYADRRKGRRDLAFESSGKVQKLPAFGRREGNTKSPGSL